MNQEDKSVKPKSKNKLLPHDAKDLEKVSDYAAKEKKEVDKLNAEVTDMNLLQLWWDSKVPEKDKCFYNFFSGKTASNRNKVLAEIKKYQNFYKELIDVMHKVSVEDEQSDWYLSVLNLSEDLSKMLEEATLGKKSTGSSTVYDLHECFIEKHEKLENMIKRVECVALKEGYRKATEGWKAAIKTINNLQNDLKKSHEKYDDMCEKFSDLEVANKGLSEQMKLLLQINKEMQQNQVILLKRMEKYEAQGEPPKN